MRRTNQPALGVALAFVHCIVGRLQQFGSGAPVRHHHSLYRNYFRRRQLPFTAQVYYSNGSVQDGTSLVTWASSNTSVPPSSRAASPPVSAAARPPSPPPLRASRRHRHIDR